MSLEGPVPLTGPAKDRDAAPPRARSSPLWDEAGPAHSRNQTKVPT